MSKRFDPGLIPPSPDLSFEERLWGTGINYIAGIDEAGRGALAGPVVTAVLILPPNSAQHKTLAGLRDSKQLSPAERDSWAGILHQEAFSWGVGFASHQEIDSWGIIPATRIAAHRALGELSLVPDHLLLDYLFLPDSDIPQTSLIKGDARSLSIAAASILAKTTRDKALIEMASTYPGYRFADHKGYGTPYHLAALKRLGPCPIHRKSFAPVKGLV
jgi:ribonuclease HII